MNYEQIEKEFDELFVKKVMLIDEPDKLAYEEMKWQVEPERIKSFLKQSFIKYLQVQIEILKDTTIESNNIDFVNGFVRANNENILDLQAQIKLLEV